VAVSPIKKRSLEPSLITEEFGTYRAARQRFREIKRQVESGELLLDKSV
jgi:exonuclease VII small subunit